jgi:hypothetical protein
MFLRRAVLRACGVTRKVVRSGVTPMEVVAGEDGGTEVELRRAKMTTKGDEDFGNGRDADKKGKHFA